MSAYDISNIKPYALVFAPADISHDMQDFKLLFENDKLFFKYNNKNAHNAKGQHVVFFYDNFVVGGGEIA